MEPQITTCQSDLCKVRYCFAIADSFFITKSSPPLLYVKADSNLSPYSSLACAASILSLAWRSFFISSQMALYDMCLPCLENFSQKPCSVRSCQLVAMYWLCQMVSLMSQNKNEGKSLPANWSKSSLCLPTDETYHSNTHLANASQQLGVLECVALT